MKKILSLLSMLMITVMAFATDYTDQLKYEIAVGSNYYPVENAKGTLSITQYDNGNYQVTAKNCDFSSNPDVGSAVGNLGNLICDGLSGTTDANGVTTIDVTECTAGLDGSSWIDMSSTKLLVKFKGDKAYATFTGKYRMSTFPYQWRTVSYTFGTDEGFDGGSTGGGETGGETSSVVTVLENFKNDGNRFSHSFKIDWDKQKVVMSIDPTSCGNDLEHIVGLGVDCTQWDGALHVYNKYFDRYGTPAQTYNRQMLQAYFPMPGNNNNTGVFDRKSPFSIEVSKDKGFVVDGEVKISASQMASLFAQANLTVGSGQGGDAASHALYKYIKVVPLGWTEPVTPPSVKEEKTFNEALYMQEQKVADATVVVKEMSDETINMSLKFSGYEYTSTELTKGTDTKGRTTYTGKVANGEQTYDVKAVVYEKDNTARLYMTMVTGVTTVVVGENPDAITPEVTEVSNKTYTSNLRILDGETTVVEEAEADVNIIKYSDESYKVTLKNVNMLNKTQDLVFVGKALIEEAPTEATEPLTIIAKSDEATTTFFGEEMNGTFEITEVSAEEIKMGFVLNNTSLEYQGEFNYTEEETPEVYTNNLHIYDAAAPETDLFQADQAKVEFLATATGGFKLTLKDVTLNEKTQDLVFTGTLPTPQPGGQDPLAEEGETTPAEPAMVLNAIADEATATFLGATSATAVFNVIMNDEAETENDAFALTFTITAGEKTLGGEFNYEKTPDVEEYPINFDKTANSTHNSRALNSFSLQQTGKEKQTKSVKTSKAAYEDHTADEPFTVEAGSELTASFDYTGEWMHSFVYIDFDNDGQFSYKEGQWDQTGTDLVAFSFYSLDSNPKNDASGYNSVGDELTGDARNTYVAPSFKAPAKAGEYRIRFKFDWNCILPGGSSTILEDGGGVWDATLKVVEPVVDGISTINVEAANGEAQLFTIDGVKLSKLQKGLNIVRTADGKVKKVLVK